MITPKLEELILCGKAFFKTFVAGGDKHTLTFGNDRFIIITDITYFPMNVPDNDGRENINTQVSIYGERGFNNFIFRNYNRDENFLPLNACSPTTINLYLLHEQQVGFSFCNARYFENINAGIANTNNPSYAPPLEYGKDGDPGALSTILTMDAISGITTLQNNFTTRPTSGNSESQQLFFAYDSLNGFSGSMYQNPEFPILHVNYVEVLGSANNIQI